MTFAFTVLDDGEAAIAFQTTRRAVVATFGLLAVIWGRARLRSSAAQFAVAAITSAHWFTASTSFANPAVTLARSATGPSRASVRPMRRSSSWPSFGAGGATALFRWLVPTPPDIADTVLMPHSTATPPEENRARDGHAASRSDAADRSRDRVSRACGFPLTPRTAPRAAPRPAALG